MYLMYPLRFTKMEGLNGFSCGVYSSEEISKNQTSIHASSSAFPEVLLSIRAGLQYMCDPRHCSLLNI